MQRREGFVDAQGHQLAYVAVNEHLDTEEQPCLVFIHGVLASVNFWLDCVPPELQKNRAWYSLSLPAHFPSTVPKDFAPEQVNAEWFFTLMSEALQKLLGNRTAIIIGHSTGGFSGLNLAIHHAPNVLGVISIGGFHSGQWGGPEGLLVKLAGLGRLARPLFASNIALAGRSRLLQGLFASMLAHQRKAYVRSQLSRKMIENLRPHIPHQNTKALFTLFNGIGRLEIADQLSQIQIPCHILAGTHDPVVPAEQSLLLAARVPHAKVTLFRNVGHMPFMEDTQAYYAALNQAIADISQIHAASQHTSGTAA